MSDTPDTNQLRMMVYASLLAALTAAGAYVSIPIGDVPVVLHTRIFPPASKTGSIFWRSAQSAAGFSSSKALVPIESY
jgi:hypothetical protein